ncbi:rho GTPase-activating protein gacF-like isoform X2 [Montipora capricornis]|uniref:rho GTPase-activating protein gacF-like isoform X2 n=2 Tax=Montipora capricornis TaxID=246305 RepID=UPI0035F12F0E
MWTALGLYAFGPNYQDIREYKKLRRRRKRKGDRRIIIPEEAYCIDEEYLPHLEEIKIQEEPYPLQDGSSVSYESEYTKFKYSMGGNIKFYDEHIALTSPRKKIKTPSQSFRGMDRSMESTFNSSLSDSVLTEKFGSMDMTPVIFNEKQENALKEESPQSLAENVTEIKTKPEKLDASAQIRATLERLKLSESATSQKSKTITTFSSVANSIAKVDSWKTDFNNSSSIPTEETAHLSAQNEGCVSDILDWTLQRQQNTSSGNGARVRDYSPIRSLARSDNLSNSQGETATIIDSAMYSYAPGMPEKKVSIERGHTANDYNTTVGAVDEKYGPTNEIIDPERVSRYNRTLLYVNEQNETLKNGDFNELDMELSDLSSDVFTDSEIPTSGFLSQSRDGKSDLDFYPDSPTTEQAFSKTPCSSRKNSLESYISDESQIFGADLDLTAALKKKVQKLEPNGAMHVHLENGNKNEYKAAPSVVKGVKAKVKLTQNTKHKTAGGFGRTEPKKKDFARNVKSKVDSFSNIGHVPGGGRIKVPSSKVKPPKSVDSRTDTHGIEAYSHLPSEFQEIAKRLAKQDREMRKSKISSSISSHGSRSRSRHSSHGSSRADSISPEITSNFKPNIRLGRFSGSSLNLNTLNTGMGHNTSNKSSPNRPPINRSPSIRSRPTTPSLSRSHPATFATLYDSRSRPSSRPSSRPNSRPSSPVSCSRNASPTNGERSSGSPLPSSGQKLMTSRRPSPNTNRSKTKLANGTGGRLTGLVGLSSVEIGLSSRSVFQVVPVRK